MKEVRIIKWVLLTFLITQKDFSDNSKSNSARDPKNLREENSEVVNLMPKTSF